MHVMFGDRFAAPIQDGAENPRHLSAPILCLAHPSFYTLRNQMPKIEAQNISKRYGKVNVVDQLNLKFGTGVIGILGPNGAGKTTLLKMLATAIDPDAGTLSLLGLNPADSQEKRALRRTLGYLPQALGYYPDFTLAEFVEYMALMKEVDAAYLDSAVAQAISAVKLADRRNDKLRTLSGGMLRRAGIAQAIVNSPQLLLLDEPTVGLDPQQRIGFRVLLRKLGENAVVIVTTHLVEDVAMACSQVAVMDAGRILFEGSPDSLIARGAKSDIGDSPIERGYSAILRG